MVASLVLAVVPGERVDKGTVPLSTLGVVEHEVQGAGGAGDDGLVGKADLAGAVRDLDVPYAAADVEARLVLVEAALAELV